ncbi:MAG TPA: GpE family phage tail protein [bacterium]|nr:GpE family phage tail protein [bacterium]
MLARWFRFPPSEIDRLEMLDFLKWCELAAEQINRETKTR